jgi:hypothetical protein
MNTHQLSVGIGSCPLTGLEVWLEDEPHLREPGQQTLRSRGQQSAHWGKVTEDHELQPGVVGEDRAGCSEGHLVCLPLQTQRRSSPRCEVARVPHREQLAGRVVWDSHTSLCSPGSLATGDTSDRCVIRGSCHHVDIRVCSPSSWCRLPHASCT